jgi:hypothetical protein
VPPFRSTPVAHLFELSNVSPAGFTAPAEGGFRAGITRLEEPVAVRCTGQPLARTPTLAAQRLADLKREMRDLAFAQASPREFARSSSTPFQTPQKPRTDIPISSPEPGEAATNADTVESVVRMERTLLSA